MIELVWNDARVRVDAEYVDPSASATVVDSAGERSYGSLAAALDGDPALVVRVDSKIGRIGQSPEGEYPEDFFDGLMATFDPESWAGTSYDPNWSEGDWSVEVDGVAAHFPLSLMNVGAPPVDQSRVGKILAVDSGGTSMTTGPVGCTLSVDGCGGIWFEEWGGEETFLGVKEVGDPVELVGSTVCSPLTRFIAGLSSDLLSESQMRQVVVLLSEHEFSEVADEAEVYGPGYESTVAEMLGRSEDPDSGSSGCAD